MVTKRIVGRWLVILCMAASSHAGTLDQATALQAAGQHQRAEQLLTDAVAQAKKSGDRKALILATDKLGVACTMTRQFDRAETLLREALAMARADKDASMTAAILNDLGNVLSLRGQYADALAAFEESATPQALVNAAAAAARAGMTDKADALNAEALKQIEKLSASPEKAFLLVSAGTTDIERNPTRAKQSFQAALEIGDHRNASYAAGYIGQLTGEVGWTQQAIFEAQQAQSPAALYKWEWQLARQLKAQGQTQPALEAYRRALQTLQPIRHDVQLGFGNSTTNATFRETDGPLFFEMADLLLQQAGSTNSQTLLLEARDTVELLKADELEDYFQDECCNFARAKAKSLETVDAHTAIIYLIPLDARTEVLVGLADGLHRFVADVGVEKLAEEVRQFRLNLETRTTYGYLEQAQQLYDWIIRPIHGLLAENRIDTLVFVPDGALRTIPFAALHNGKEFLIQVYAIAVTPGLSLLEPHPISRANARLLLSGLSDSVQGFPALDFVPGELRSIETTYPSEKLLNKQFTMPVIKEKLTEEQFAIVHIASHGQFRGNVRDTFVLTYDNKLTLNDLEALIRPSQYRGQPVEMLVLSACQTASGDDRAALGLAGVAVKAGARSALASLWFVNDQSTAALVSELYEQLRSSPSISKARALQAAQIKMLNDRRYRHPCYWSPYLLIGNWL